VPASKPAASLLTRHATVVVGPASEIPNGERKIVDTDAGECGVAGECGPTALHRSIWDSLSL
jgi:hypothetical protein